MEQTHADKYATKTGGWRRIIENSVPKNSYIKGTMRRIESGAYLSIAAPVPKDESNSSYLTDLSSDSLQAIFDRGIAAYTSLTASQTDYLSLHSLGVLEEFREFLRSRNLIDYGTTAARAWLYSRITNSMVSRRSHSPCDALEIGAGSGYMATCLIWTGCIRSFTFVDLPEMLPFSAYWIAHHFGIDNIGFGVGCQQKFRFLTPDELMELPRQSIDLSININSFAEMDNFTVKYYFEQIYRTSRPSSLHFNVNRDGKAEQSNGEVLFSNPLIYPYQPDDHVLFWEVDQFSLIKNSGFFGSRQNKNNAYARGSIIHPTDEDRRLVIAGRQAQYI